MTHMIKLAHVAPSLVIGYQEFHQVCQVLSTVLCIGDIKIEEDVSNYHLGEISAIANPLHVMVGK